MSEEILQSSCEMMGIVGVIVQLVLGLMSFSVLIFKRQHQYPKRPWKIWALDTSKQAASQLIAHFVNIAISLTLSVHLANDACFWYFTTNVLDNTIGVFICVGVLMLIERKIFDKKYEHLKSGNYFKVREVYDENFSTIQSRSSQLEGGLELESLEMVHVTRKININYKAWFLQFLTWNAIVIVCKSLLFILELTLNQPLNAITLFLLGWVQEYPAFELVIVIIIVPVMMNGLAFWIQDNFLKKRYTKAELLSKETLL